jgi:hypothetical protein
MRVCSAADFVRITASWGIISAGLIAVGCGDPDLTLRIRIPTAQQSTTDVVAVELYEPSATQPLDCDAMAFDTVPQRAREISRIRTVYLDEGSGPIGPVDRLSTTLVVAHALSATSQSIASGCAAIAPFRADLTLELELEPTICSRADRPPRDSANRRDHRQRPSRWRIWTAIHAEHRTALDRGRRPRRAHGGIRRNRRSGQSRACDRSAAGSRPRDHSATCALG